MLNKFLNSLRKNTHTKSHNSRPRTIKYSRDTTLNGVPSNTRVIVTNGSLVVNGPVGDNVYIELTGSDLTKTLLFRNQVGKNATIKNFGHIEFKGHIGEGANISTTFGNIKGLSFPKNTKINSNSGTITANRLAGDVQTHSGRVQIKTLNSHATINTFTGNIQIDVAHKFSRISSTEGQISIKETQEPVTLSNVDGKIVCGKQTTPPPTLPRQFRPIPSSTSTTPPTLSRQSRPVPSSTSRRQRSYSKTPKSVSRKTTASSIKRKRSTQSLSTPFFEGMDFQTFLSTCKHNGLSFKKSFKKLSDEINRTLNNEVKVPNELCCPISKTLMIMPVKIPMGGNLYKTIDYASFVKIKRQGQGRMNPFTNSRSPNHLIFKNDLKPDLEKAKAIYNYLNGLEDILEATKPVKTQKRRRRSKV